MLVQGLAKRLSQLLPFVPIDALQHVEQDCVKHGQTDRLERQTDALFFLADSWVFALHDWLQQVCYQLRSRGALLLVCVNLNLCLEHEIPPLLPPICFALKENLVAVDSCRSKVHFSIRSVNCVSHPVWHRCQPFAADFAVLEETRYQFSVLVLLAPVFSHLVQPLEPTVGEILHQLLKHFICQDLHDRYVSLRRMIDEVLYCFHQRVVCWVLMGDPVFEGVIVNSSDVPCRRQPYLLL
mmetsp:Transcript_24087/g.37802  ORF Transcript_24087/g.37802 Transcript_24087/m.37802 type:complete len:239 (+) Transcript_24087:1090-1806(+)